MRNVVEEHVVEEHVVEVLGLGFLLQLSFAASMSLASCCSPASLLQLALYSGVALLPTTAFFAWS